jgi:hypothetical protein
MPRFPAGRTPAKSSGRSGSPPGTVSTIARKSHESQVSSERGVGHPRRFDQTQVAYRRKRHLDRAAATAYGAAR